MALIGRSLIRHGEVVFLIDTQAGKLRLIPAETHDIEGSPFPKRSGSTALPLVALAKTVTYDYRSSGSVDFALPLCRGTLLRHGGAMDRSRWRRWRVRLESSETVNSLGE